LTLVDGTVAVVRLGVFSSTSARTFSFTAPAARPKTAWNCMGEVVLLEAFTWMPLWVSGDLAEA
jgi:hypothetical protein